MTAPGRSPMDRNRRALLLGGVALAIILVAFLAIRLVSGSAGAPTGGAVSLPPGAPATTAPTTTSTTSPDGVSSFNAYMQKDPFQKPPGTPTGSASPASGSGGTSGTATTTPGAGSGATGSGATGSGSTGGGATGGGASGTATAPTRGDEISLLDVFAQGGRTVATVRVNSIVYKVAPGDGFATYYTAETLDLSTQCGKFLYGHHYFTLCKGQQILK